MPPKGVFPLRENCDPNDPEEFALWAFAALPGVNGAPLIMPVEYYRLVSKRLWELGFRHVQEPELEYLPPSANEPHWATSPGRWVKMGTVSDEEKMRRQFASGLARMGHQQKVELFKALQAAEAGEALPDTKAAGVVRSMTPVQRRAVLDLLTESQQ